MSILGVLVAFLILFVNSQGPVSLDECTVPPYSIPLHEVNVTTATGNLLLTEGRCYLDCLELPYYNETRVQYNINIDLAI